MSRTGYCVRCQIAWRDHSARTGISAILFGKGPQICPDDSPCHSQQPFCGAWSGLAKQKEQDVAKCKRLLGEIKEIGVRDAEECQKLLEEVHSRENQLEKAIEEHESSIDVSGSRELFILRRGDDEDCECHLNNKNSFVPASTAVIKRLLGLSVHIGQSIHLQVYTKTMHIPGTLK